ncbi:PREDICTED: putative nuclease HARBI1 [Vollenhovia emeryi]|uniref:putative nuclease HARBI1 n=1 Tax=Vollenhovia emeryi TaxID=411798 RepID=UPI0005F4AA6D|nr:PREDICTED: putative nuclease HARBI1 [Vollenhovia emeryi]XP_011884126.1 PREDICTED: putative nuclease HARBI1 [Vollenhovia emeryi]XP_011884127.1 PREDICTED: putative nuclease HARBI1 [Vollenhovia emeryi]XP_011884128.1 PREDICTED: putative nuclease HARBI1 [Vollenhovia emeryi]
MENEELMLFICTMQVTVLALYTAWKAERGKRWKNRRWWVRPINTRRKVYGDFATLFSELKEDVDLFFRYTRMDVSTFYELLRLVSPYLQKRSMRPSISPEQRLAITLRYLATGDQMLSTALAYRVGESTAHMIVKETCSIIANVLMPIYVKSPTEEKWKEICADFLALWNLPNCTGAIDGKHITIQAPPNSGSVYFNYKKTFSIVLMATCDAKYRFTLFDVGSYGSDSDGGILSRSAFGKALYGGILNLPRETARLPGSDKETPCYFVGDEAFQMSINMMRPYPGKTLNDQKRMFNYRLSRARRTIENTFGILAARWRILRRPICAGPEAADKFVLAAICLHNFLKAKNDETAPQQQRYCPPQFVDREIEGQVMRMARIKK